eukprot:3548214-Pleurochrysis_carterae.AAC.1
MHAPSAARRRNASACTACHYGLRTILPITWVARRMRSLHEGQRYTSPTYTSFRYKPSYAGRRIHADMAGPFLRSQRCNFQYALILVDDHHTPNPCSCCATKAKPPTAIR